ncbi:uncharacterized protein LOC142591145 [Dermacentor variabilis]|uniref:uncharacterized protein LOC142591145 n=1 Tax=Dermacentor variabilis TaxID=34621 RepID=UPI003F5C422C
MQATMKVSLFAVNILIVASTVEGKVNYPPHPQPHTVECPIRSSQNGCVAFGSTIPPGQAKSFRDPCVNVECSSNGRRLTVEGCSPSGNICDAEPLKAAPDSLAWPFCCARCRGSSLPPPPPVHPTPPIHPPGPGNPIWPVDPSYPWGRPPHEYPPVPSYPGQPRNS